MPTNSTVLDRADAEPALSRLGHLQQLPRLHALCMGDDEAEGDVTVQASVYLRWVLELGT